MCIRSLDDISYQHVTNAWCEGRGNRGGGVVRNLRTCTARCYKDLEHVEVMKPHLLDDGGWIPHPRCRERGAKGCTRDSLCDKIHSCDG